MQKIHFISGLPRAGSTLLTSILNQNPRFASDITDPLYQMVKSVRNASANDPSSGSICSEERRANALIGLITEYYSSSKPIVFNTNRGWCSQLPLLHELFPDARVIAMVRNPVYVLNSFEKLYQRNPLAVSTLYDHDARRNVYTRATHLMDMDRPIGLGMKSLNEGLMSIHKDKILCVDYKELCDRPGEMMKQIHAFINEPEFTYDFENVETARHEYDASLDAKGLHDVRKKVEYRQEALVLPLDLIKQVEAGVQGWLS